MDPPALPDTRFVLQCPHEPRVLPTPPMSFPYSFAAGDVVLIQPQNAASHVQQFCQVLGLDPEQCFTLQPREPGELTGALATTLLPRPPLCPQLPEVSCSLQMSPAPRGCLSPALCGTSCPSTWTSLACHDAPSSSCWPACPPASWNGTSCWSSALPQARRSCPSTAAGPAGPRWRCGGRWAVGWLWARATRGHAGPSS